MSESHTPGNVWPSPGETEKEFQQRIEKPGKEKLPKNSEVF